MSVYSGFSTRNLEDQYNKNLLDLIQLMQAQLLALMENSCLNFDSFSTRFCRVYKSMHTLEKKKYMEPRFTASISGLANFFNFESSPELSEMDSETSIERKYTNSYYRYVNS